MTGNSRILYFSSSDESSVASSESDVDDYEYLATPSRTKKRVQFLAGEELVRIREIPARCHSRTSDEEDTASSDDDGDNDDDDNDDDVDDDGWAGGGGSDNPVSTMPVIVGNAVKLERGLGRSYAVSRTKGRNSTLVAQIAGLAVTGKSKSRRAGSKERKPKKSSKTTEKCPDTSKSKQKGGGGRKRQTRKEPERAVPSNKRIKDVKDIKFNFTSVKQSSPKPFGIKKVIPRLETRPYLSAQHHTHNGADTHLTSTHMSLQNMSLEKLYTVDRFIFPSDPSERIRTRSAGNSIDKDLDGIETSKSMTQRKKCFAWKMANGDQQTLLFGTPSILPLWENVQSHTTTATNGIKTKI